MKFLYRRIFHHEKNKFPGIISSVIKYKYNDNYDLERLDVKNDLTNPVKLDDYELILKELDKDRPVLYNRLLSAMELLDTTPIIHFTDSVKKKKVYPGDRYTIISLCIFSSSNTKLTPLYREEDTDNIFRDSNIFSLTRASHYKLKSKPKVGRPKKK